MNLYVLSENSSENKHIGWSVSRDLDGVLAEVFDAKFLYPKQSGPHHMSSLSSRLHQRLFKSWFQLEDLPTLGKGCNVLLIVGMVPHFLLSMYTLGPLLKQFDVRIGYLLDGFDPESIDAAIAPHLDHLFVIDAKLAEQVNQRQLVPTHFMPIAINMDKAQLQPGRRSIDLLSYGRRNEFLHQQLLHHIQSSNHSLFYHYSTMLHPVSLNLDEHTLLHSQLLSQSKISLCFDASARFRGLSPLLYRWLEAWAHGCVVAGKKPSGLGVAELLDWQDSTFELPDDRADWVPFLDELLADEDRLAEVALRNYQQASQRHDWRDRLLRMLMVTGLPIPPQLQEGLDELQRRVGSNPVVSGAKLQNIFALA
jgi:hypothetical protein